jgi:LacI family transcriptional regulator
MREHATDFQVLEPLVNLDDARIAYEAAMNLIASTPDLVGVYAAGGGAEGLIEALRDEKAADRIVAVCNELTSATRSALIDGTLDVVLDTPIVDISKRAVDILARATTGESWDMVQSIQLPATLVISESL